MEFKISRVSCKSLQPDIENGLKVKGTSIDWRSATIEINTPEDLQHILEVTNQRDMIVEIHNGERAIQLHDDYLY